MIYYLDFEGKIKELDEAICVAQKKKDTQAVAKLQSELKVKIKKVYSNLTPYQKLQIARHPDRVHSIDCIKALLKDPYELHGDRNFRDDPSILSYIGYIGDKKVIVIAQEKGRGTKNKIYRNFGMPYPEGYRKVIRIAKLADKFSIPIFFLVDTPGAYPGIEAEYRGQSEAIARALFELSKLKTITISVVIGEGGSGGALAMSLSDKLAMMRYAVFSVITPEGGAAILWGDASKKVEMANAMKFTPKDLKHFNLIDDIVKEPIEGAHRDKDRTFKALYDYFMMALEELEAIPTEERLQMRYKKILSYGAFQDTKQDKDSSLFKIK